MQMKNKKPKLESINLIISRIGCKILSLSKYFYGSGDILFLLQDADEVLPQKVFK